MQKQVHYELIHNDDFADAIKRAEFITEMEGFSRLVFLANGRKVEISNMCEMPVLKKEQEQYLFRQYNALKYEANLALDKHDYLNYALLGARIKQVKDVLTLCNIRLVVNFLKKKHYDDKIFHERFSDALEGLIRAVEKFNYAKGNKFSTYCIWALINCFVKVSEVEKREKRIHYIDSEIFLNHYDPLAPEETSFVLSDELKKFIDKLFRLANLSKNEIQAILENSGIGVDSRTFVDISKDMKCSKERVRQIKQMGIKKIKKVLESKRMSLEIY